MTDFHTPKSLQFNNNLNDPIIVNDKGKVSTHTPSKDVESLYTTKNSNSAYQTAN